VGFGRNLLQSYQSAERPVSSVSSVSSDPSVPSHHVVTFTDVAEELKTKYNVEESITSTALDILALYLKGQKILHIEAKTLCEKRLHSLMLPSIKISSICAILNFALQNVSYGTIAVSSCNVFNAFLMTLVSYLKLDAKAQTHQSAAYKYQKLESYCEFISGRVLFFANTEEISTIVNDIHNRVLEIKESSTFILPESIRHRFNTIYSTNVFTLVKAIQNKEIIIINRLKVILQKIQKISQEQQQMKSKHREQMAELLTLEQESVAHTMNHYRILRDHMHQQAKSIMYRDFPLMEEDSKSYEEKMNELMEEMDVKQIEQGIEEIQVRRREKEREKKEEIRGMEEKQEVWIARKEALEKEKIEALEEVIEFRTEYLNLNETFDDELQKDRVKQKRCCDVCSWCKT
jgi:hypothetical protein